MIKLEQLQHRGEKVVALRGNISATQMSAVKRIPGIRYSATHRCYYFKYSAEALMGLEENLSLIVSELSTTEKLQNTEPTEKERKGEVPAEFREMLVRKRYSESTRRNYCVQIRNFMAYLNGNGIDQIDDEQIRKYILYLVNVKKQSSATQNVAVNAIKFYLEHVQSGERKIYYNERPRKTKQLPIVLSEEEIEKLFSGTKNIKHKAIMYLLYSGGLRISELLNLRWRDIDLDRSVIYIRMGKGSKDRVTLLSRTAYDFLIYYRKKYPTVDYVFEGVGGGEYSARSVNNIIKRCAACVGLKKNVSAHTLRHSFATHLLEHGTDLRYIQALLGHESSRTTEVYTHVTRRGFEKLKSPLDNLGIERIFRDSTPDNGDI
jgi:integrase/recombinase XerD